MIANNDKHYRRFSLDRLFFRYLKSSKFENKMSVIELAMILAHKNVIRLVEIDGGILRYEQLINLSRDGFMKLMKERF